MIETIVENTRIRFYNNQPNAAYATIYGEEQRCFRGKETKQSLVLEPPKRLYPTSTTFIDQKDKKGGYDNIPTSISLEFLEKIEKNTDDFRNMIETIPNQRKRD